MNCRITSLLFALLTTCSGWAAEVAIVVESTVPDIAVGDQLDATVDVNIQFGQRLQLYDKNGDLYVLQGPYSGPPLVGDRRSRSSFREQTVKALNQLIGKGLVEQDNLGGIRGPSELSSGNQPPDAWLLPLGNSVVHCVLDDKITTILWDPAAPGGRVEVRNIARNSAGTVSWPEGADRTPWPTDVSIEDEAIFLIRSDAGIRSSAVITRLVPASLPQDHRMAFWLASEGCMRQARLIARAAGGS